MRWIYLILFVASVAGAVLYLRSGSSAKPEKDTAEVGTTANPEINSNPSPDFPPPSGGSGSAGGPLGGDIVPQAQIAPKSTNSAPSTTTDHPETNTYPPAGAPNMDANPPPPGSGSTFDDQPPPPPPPPPSYVEPSGEDEFAPPPPVTEDEY